MKIDVAQLEFIDLMLREIVREIEENYGVEFTITSLYRINSAGVHGVLPLRGIDLRCRDHELGLLVKKFVNSNWKYDSSRPNKMCCLFHNAGSGFHLHIQTHPNTRKI